MLKVASIFSQILGAISSTDFEKLVLKHGAERNAKGFRCWTQLGIKGSGLSDTLCKSWGYP